MRFASFLGAALASTLGLLASRLASRELIPSHAYQTVKPITEKNVGRNYLKYGNSKYRPHQGERECARRRRRMAA